MVKSAVRGTTRRYLNILRRALEVTAVLSACFIVTVLNICFGWVALLFKASPRADRALAQTVVLAPAKVSKEY